MFKNNISQFNDLCPLDVAKNFIRDKIFEMGTTHKKLENIDISDFTQLEIDFVAGCLIANDDYNFDFLFESHDFFYIKKSVVSFMVNPKNYIQTEFLLLTKMKAIAIEHYHKKIEFLIEDVKPDVTADLIDYWRVENEAN